MKATWNKSLCTRFLRDVHGEQGVAGGGRRVLRTRRSLYLGRPRCRRDEKEILEKDKIHAPPRQCYSARPDPSRLLGSILGDLDAGNVDKLFSLFCRVFFFHMIFHLVLDLFRHSHFPTRLLIRENYDSGTVRIFLWQEKVKVTI